MEGCLQSSAERALGGTGERVFTALPAQADANEDLSRVVSVDSTAVRAHQHAAGARRRGLRPTSPLTTPIGRSRGGLTTKIRLAADGNCRPLAFVLTAGQAGDAPAFTDVMARLRIPVVSDVPGPGRTWSLPTRRTPPGPEQCRAQPGRVRDGDI